MKAADVRVSKRWLALREPADAAARARDLVEHLARMPPVGGRWMIHDLGCGAGAMGRWLAPLLPGPQHWVLQDRDPDLLEAADADHPGPAADGAAVTVRTRRSDITRLGAADLAGSTLVTASALLDMLVEEELVALLDACVEAGCPTLMTLSVVGQVSLTPSDPLDRRVAASFNEHQRRVTGRGRLLGPDSVAAAVARCGRLGAGVLVRSSPWRIGASHADLALEWLTGWVSAACEQEPALTSESGDYARRRAAELEAGQLAITVGHTDLLILPRGRPG